MRAKAWNSGSTLHSLALAARAHEGQVRKGTRIPYITHPVAVSALVAAHGGDEEQMVAALLHDVLEDGGAHYAAEIAERFGPRVLRLVQGCTDGVPDAAGEKPPWAERKRAYLAHLSAAPDEVLLVSGCDKLCNAGDIVADLRALGPAVFARFTAGRDGTLWYYAELARLFAARRAPMAGALGEAVAAMHAAAGLAGSNVAT